MYIKRVLFSVILISACAGASRESETPATLGGIYEVTNRSACTVRIVLHDLDGHVIEHMKFEDLRPGRTERYRLPSPAMKLDAIGIDALGNSCGMAENQKIQITKVQ
jgi:hypothetical protein